MSILEEIKKLSQETLVHLTVKESGEKVVVKGKAVLLSDIERVLEKDWMICELCSLFAKCQIIKLFDLNYCSQFERK